MKTKKQMLEGVTGITKSKIVGNNTVEYFNAAGERFIRLHATNVLQFNPDGKIILNSGGWKTHTTKDRLNHFLPSGYYITQKAGIWYLQNPAATEIIFQDGMVIDTITGKIQKEGKLPDTKTITTRINKYVAGYMAALIKGKVEKPGLGDCFYCACKTEPTNLSWGEVTSNTEHLKSHFTEKYYVPSMLTNAIRVFPVSIYAQSALMSCWLDGNMEFLTQNDIATDQLKRSLTRFLKRQFGLAC